MLYGSAFQRHAADLLNSEILGFLAVYGEREFLQIPETALDGMGREVTIVMQLKIVSECYN